MLPMSVVYRLQVYVSSFTPLQSSKLLSFRPPPSNGTAPPLPHLSCAPVQPLLPLPSNLLFLLDLSPAHNLLLKCPAVLSPPLHWLERLCFA